MTIPDNVTSIGSSAFSGCTSLTSIVIPSSVNSMGGGAFADCSGLRTVELHSTMDDGVFSSWFPQTVQNVVLGDEITNIKEWFFYECENLISVFIPNSVTSIDGASFYGCTNLAAITIPNSVKIINSNAFQDCQSLTSIDIPNSVETIGISTFEACIGLTSIIIPHSVTEIGSSAFSGCNELRTVEFHCANIKGLKNLGLENVKNVVIGEEVENIRWNSYDFKSSKTIEFHCKKIQWNWGQFADFTGLRIGREVTDIDPKAFQYQSVEYGCKLKFIEVASENLVFDSRENCNAVIKKSDNQLVLGCQNSIIPNSVKTIGDGAFRSCHGLTSIIIPNSVTSIGEDAFHVCIGLISVEIPNSVISIGNKAFGGCWGLKSVVIPNSVACIGKDTFYSCQSLKFVAIPNSVTSIGDWAFISCRDLVSVVSRIEKPFVFGSSAFGVSSTCRLYVPFGKKNAYISEGWTEEVFKGGIFELGDANGDEKITITDAVDIVSHIIDDDIEKFGSFFAVADVNGDGKITITDAVAIVDMIINGSASAKKRMMAEETLDPQ